MLWRAPPPLERLPLEHRSRATRSSDPASILSSPRLDDEAAGPRVEHAEPPQCEQREGLGRVALGLCGLRRGGEREFVLGGAPRGILQTMTVPVLMAC
jgi:hypothetical protein